MTEFAQSEGCVVLLQISWSCERSLCCLGEIVDGGCLAARIVGGERRREVTDTRTRISMFMFMSIAINV